MSIGVIADHYFGSGLVYSAEVLAEASLLVYPRLGEASGTTMNDASGNGRNGTYQNSPTLGVAGALFSEADTAVNFVSASSQYGVIANAAWMNGIGSLTMDAWFKTTATSGTIFGRGGSAGVASQYRIGVTGGKGFVEVRTTVNLSVFLTGSTTINDGVWHYICGRWSGSQLMLGIDGASDATPAPATGVLTGTSTNALRVGQRSADSFFNGDIDECALYSSDIGSTRMAAHYAAR